MSVAELMVVAIAGHAPASMADKLNQLRLKCKRRSGG